MTNENKTPSFRERIRTAAKAATNAFWQPTNVSFSPGEPLRPMSPTEPIRREDYQIGRNILTTPRQAEPRDVTYSQMRRLARMHGVLRTLIEKRKDEMKGLEWDIAVKTEFANQGYEAEAKQERKFWQKPDCELTFDQWLGILLEDLFVIDAMTLYKERDRAGRFRSLQVVDGSTILVLVDDRGRVPFPPQMAYEQVIKGYPMTSYIRPVAGANPYTYEGGEMKGLTIGELYYRPYNLASDGVYGFSHVESIIMMVNIALRRDVSFLEWFRSGNVPPGLIPCPPDWTPQQIAEFEDMFNTMLAGDLAARSKLHAVPGGGGNVQMLQQLSFDALFDEWLARVMCARFGCSPAPYVRMMNRATAETIEDAATEESIEPLKQHMKALFDDVIANDREKPYLEFVWTSGQLHYRQADNQMHDTMLKDGAITLDEWRKLKGEPPIPGGIGSKHMVWTGTGPVLLENIVNGNYKPPTDYRLSIGDGKPDMPRLSIHPENEGMDTESPFELAIRSIKAELDAWEKFSVKRVGKATRDFEVKAIPQPVAEAIKSSLIGTHTADEVKAVFDTARNNLGRRRTPAIGESLDKLMSDYEAELKPIIEKAKSKV